MLLTRKQHRQVKAARAALRLDPDLLPPLGAKLLMRHDGRLYAMTIVAYSYTTEFGEGRCISVGASILGRIHRVPVARLEHGFVIRLPEGCPPMDRWPRAKA